MRIEVVDHQPSWNPKFQAQAKVIAGALNEKALRIEHIGSTAVNGLAAKPIIDILLVVENSADECSYLPQLQAAGYELRVREPDFYEHRMLSTPAKDVHIHVYSPTSPEIERYLTLRNRLRENDSDRGRYEETKLRLAAKEWPDMDAYANAKTEIIETIIAAACLKSD